MSYFATADEVYEYVGGVFRLANDTPGVGEKLRAADMVLRLNYRGPDATITVVMKQPAVQVITGPTDVKPDVVMALSSDNADKYWRGEYNVAVGLAKGEVKAKGPVTKILKLIPVTKPLFPMYKELVATKDAAR
ncbi:SCP2 sterol-binding domain-containing protein [Nocardia crassostreae]|uniref:SCP2 sterol-binding domain-containing protein n=1 Tax=Nocardia crassostreae TaxID=53428 RepID=UPI0008358238|nr:SCP2 sterol-binding domain-containing protein [Nocardia crassostreae]